MAEFHALLEDSTDFDGGSGVGRRGSSNGGSSYRGKYRNGRSSTAVIRFEGPDVR